VRPVFDDPVVVLAVWNTVFELGLPDTRLVDCVVFALATAVGAAAFFTVIGGLVEQRPGTGERPDPGARVSARNCRRRVQRVCREAPTTAER
jgi:hypothetical protein